MGLVNLKVSGIWFKQIFLEDNVHVEREFNILQSFSGIEQRRSISNFCLTRRVYRWTSTRSCDRKAVSSNGTKIWIQMGYQSELSKCGGGSFRLQLRLVWSLVNEKSNFGSQNPGLDWWKGTTQHMTGFAVRDFFFQDLFQWEFFYGWFFLVLYLFLSIWNVSFPQHMNGV